MIKAVFFDWFNTLAHYNPPREELESRALGEFDINVPPEKLKHGIIIADKEYFKENSVSPIRERSPQEQHKLRLKYQKNVLEQAGINAPEELFTKIMARLRELYKQMAFALFDDVLAILKILKDQNYTLGLLTNIQRGMEPICQNLGVMPYLNFIVTSGEAGAEKPQPQVFLLALQKSGVAPSEAVHIGDQYALDVIGARSVGIKPILIDRFDFPTTPLSHLLNIPLIYHMNLHRDRLNNNLYQYHLFE